MNANTSSEEQSAWQDSAAHVTSAHATQALIGGVNIRINVFKSFKAVYITAKLAFKAKKIALTGFTHPAELLGMAKDVFDAVVTTLDALREKMTPLAYTACVVLSNHENGLGRADFEKALREFLAEPEQEEMPWYLGLTKSHLKDSRSELSRERAFDKLMDQLKKDDWLDEDSSGHVKYRPRHYTWGASLS